MDTLLSCEDRQDYYQQAPGAMAEGAGFYVGVFTVVAGLGFIVGMGFWSIYNPYKGEKFNQNNELYQNNAIFLSPNMP